MNAGQAAANVRTLRRLLLLVLAMFGFVFALVPMYNTFCNLTGFNRGEIQAAARNTQVDPSRQVRVELLANVQDNAPWRFTAPDEPVALHPGQIVQVEYWIENLTDHHISGRAVPSYGPQAAVLYLHKIECFCFRDLDLAPHEKRPLPVMFVLDRKIPRDMTVVTLSYTFFQLTYVKDTAPPATNRITDGLQPIDGART